MELKVIHNTQFHWFGLILVIFQWFNATVPTNEQYFRITQDETKPEVSGSKCNYVFLKNHWKLTRGRSSFYRPRRKIIGLGGYIFGRRSNRVFRIKKDFWAFIRIEESRLRNILTKNDCHSKLNFSEPSPIDRNTAPMTDSDIERAKFLKKWTEADPERSSSREPCFHLRFRWTSTFLVIHKRFD